MANKTKRHIKEEIDEILCGLTDHLMDSECKDLELLGYVDGLCSRNWHDIHRGWVRWAFYIEQLLGSREAYTEWTNANR